MRAAWLTILATCLRLRAGALAILELSPIASDTAHSPTTSRIASGSPRNRCDHCLDCEETLPARSLTSARGWSDWERPLCDASNPWILGTIVSAAAHSPTRCRIASATARNRRHVARIVSKAARILDFARIASALVVVVGVTSHLGSGAALSPRRCRIASVGAHSRTEMLRLRGVLLTILRRASDG